VECYDKQERVSWLEHLSWALVEKAIQVQELIVSRDPDCLEGTLNDLILLVSRTSRECIPYSLLELTSRRNGRSPRLLSGLDYLASEHGVESLIAKAFKDLIEFHLLRVIDDFERSALLATVSLRIEPHVERLIVVADVGEPSCLILQLIATETQVKQGYVMQLVDSDALSKCLLSVDERNIDVVGVLKRETLLFDEACILLAAVLHDLAIEVSAQYSQVWVLCKQRHGVISASEGPIYQLAIAIRAHMIKEVSYEAGDLSVHDGVVLCPVDL